MQKQQAQEASDDSSPERTQRRQNEPRREEDMDGLGDWKSQHVWTVASVIKAAGYKVEQHTVTTDDGYKLRMERLPRKGSCFCMLVNQQCNHSCCVSCSFVVQGLFRYTYMCSLHASDEQSNRTSSCAQHVCGWLCMYQATVCYICNALSVVIPLVCPCYDNCGSFDLYGFGYNR